MSHDSVGRSQSPSDKPWSFAVACQGLPTCAAICIASAKPLQKEEIRRAQRKDKDIKLVIHQLQSGVKPSCKQWRFVGSSAKGLMREWVKLILDEDDFLQRKSAQRT